MAFSYGLYPHIIFHMGKHIFSYTHLCILGTFSFFFPLLTCFQGSVSGHWEHYSGHGLHESGCGGQL